MEMSDIVGLVRHWGRWIAVDLRVLCELLGQRGLLRDHESGRDDGGGGDDLLRWCWLA